MDGSVARLLQETWTSPVFGDTFPEQQMDQRHLWAERHIGAIATPVTSELSAALLDAMPEWDSATVARIVQGEVRDKTISFGAALTGGEIGDLQPLIDLSVAVGLMYAADQTIDRGDRLMVEAVESFGAPPVSSDQSTSLDQWDAATGERIHARSTMLHRISEKTESLALPEDAPFVKACFIDQVLKNEAVMYRWSRAYESGNATEQQIFLTEHARALANTTTINAGFPSISSSLYAIYRRYNPSLSPLSEVYKSKDMTDLLQVCNVIVRIWDELGDWEMDSGSTPHKGIFVLNPLNQYHNSTVERYCELANITDAGHINALHKAFAGFHHSEAERGEHTTLILEMLRSHIRNYMTKFKTEKRQVWNKFEQYIVLCKRVMEIGYVNRIGDIALANTEMESDSHDA